MAGRISSPGLSTELSWPADEGKISPPQKMPPGRGGSPPAAGAEPAPFVGPRAPAAGAGSFFGEEKMKNSRSPAASVPLGARPGSAPPTHCGAAPATSVSPPHPEEPPIRCVLCAHPRAQPHHAHRVLIASVSAFCPNLGHFRGASHSGTGSGEFFRAPCAPRSPDPPPKIAELSPCRQGKPGAGL